jgi:hypothetical protein
MFFHADDLIYSCMHNTAQFITLFCYADRYDTVYHKVKIWGLVPMFAYALRYIEYMLWEYIIIVCNLML